MCDVATPVVGRVHGDVRGAHPPCPDGPPSHFLMLR